MTTSPRSRRFLQLDVFADQPLRGNPLAVVLDAEDLGEEDMQRLARWTNLSETTFLLPPTREGADYRVRIWTPSGELHFAGHPTLGTARSWLHAGGVPAGERIVQECAAGLVEVRVEEGAHLAFAAPPLLRSGPLEEADVAQLAAAIGVDREAVIGHCWADNGPGWRVLELGSDAEVLALRPDAAALGDAKLGVVGRCPRPDPDLAARSVGAAADTPLYEVRAFTLRGVEDPVTGSLNAGIAQWMLSRGEVPSRWTAAQGTVLGREGRVAVEVERSPGADAPATVWIGGSTVLTVEGTILL
ncbi:PhzF family phenazine biosynthesis protein [Brachybacterium sp. AOP43-C2-M15]|uniref:PhzF family phenazine biosynthesis protein n=1 Tax=Brachybacterium sp. AOP43-C2-M15 TaxID=3457661 RepID=UPI00403355A5